MRVPVDSLENGTFEHINYFDMCVQSEKPEKTMGTTEKEVCFQDDLHYPRRGKKRQHQTLGD